MNLLEARCRARQLNAEGLIKRQEERLRELRSQRQEMMRRFEAILPEEFVAEFEKRFVWGRDDGSDAERRRQTRALALWRAAQKVIIAISKDPSEWFYDPIIFYDYFYERKYSLRYIHNMLKFVNLWGSFVSRKMGRFFVPIPAPHGYERQRLVDAYYEKRKNARRPSKPLTPRQLSYASRKINRANHNWLWLSVWLGLRPKEVDSLHSKEMWSIETRQSGRKILWVYQTKLIALPPEDRWKPIPIILPQQEDALRIIGDGWFRRPLLKTMLLHFGRNTTLYAGRKGFVDLMLSKGQTLENISIWMGHSTVDRTWRSYKHLGRFHFGVREREALQKLA